MIRCLFPNPVLLNIFNLIAGAEVFKVIFQLIVDLVLGKCQKGFGFKFYKNIFLGLGYVLKIGVQTF